MKVFMKTKWFKFAAFSLVGAIAGFAYYYFIGCYNGHCLITSNPYISTGYGMAAGLILAWDNKKKPRPDKD